MIEEHLKVWLSADSRAAEFKRQIALLQDDKKHAEKEADMAAKAIQEEMATTGEYEIIVPGEYCNYKIYFTVPRESVKVIADAVPDEFCKIERTPKLKEIGEFLKTQENPPNWAKIEIGESSLTYKLLKKAAA